jgi:hypothetical protein
VQVRPGRAAGAAGIADHLAALDGVAGAYARRGHEVTIERGVSIRVIDQDVVAIAAVVGADGDAAVCHRPDAAPGLNPDVDAERMRRAEETRQRAGHGPGETIGGYKVRHVRDAGLWRGFLGW